VALLATARMYLGVDAPSDVLVGAVIGVAVPLLAFRWFVPNEVFPISYRRSRSTHLDIGGQRGQAIRHALQDQLGLEIEDVKRYGMTEWAGSTPLLITVKGEPHAYLFGKLYARRHLRADRWYKLGRELLYGRLEDEKPFHTVRRLVQQEDYALHKLYAAGLPTPRPYGFVELTPDWEYLLVTEFFQGATSLDKAQVDQAVIDDGLSIIRQLWDAGLAHRDIQPANLLVRDGHMLLVNMVVVEARPSPWRQAVDLATMLPCLGLRSDPKLVYERALGQFSVEDKRGVRGQPRACPALTAGPYVAGAGSGSVRRVRAAAARAAAAGVDPALEPAARRTGAAGRPRPGHRHSGRHLLERADRPNQHLLVHQ
jgi:hypothetical protein